MLCLGWLAILQDSTVYLYVNNGCVDLINKVENAPNLLGSSYDSVVNKTVILAHLHANP